MNLIDNDIVYSEQKLLIAGNGCLEKQSIDISRFIVRLLVQVVIEAVFQDLMASFG